VSRGAGPEFSISLARGRHLGNICGRKGGRAWGGQSREANLLGQSMVAFELRKCEATGWWWDCGDKDEKPACRLPLDYSAPEQPCGFAQGNDVMTCGFSKDN